ncbi:MAG: fucose 4-O-acetylase-like acetyltransferase, partial [Saprospiraceae bacterium]
MKTRIFFLDNLRTFLVFFVILYHAGFVYQSSLAGNWLVVDPVKSESIALVGMYIDTFVMFMLFFISGYFVPGSLKNKTARGFLSAKFKRIYLPWFIAVFTLIPAYK